MRITEFGYDWRGRQTHVFREEDAEGNITYEQQTYDNLNRTVKSERFLLTENTGTALPTGSERIAVLQNNLADDILLARSEQFYDERGHVWKTEQSVVNPQDGTVQGKFAGQFWYDAAGRRIKSLEPGANHITETVYDSLGRVDTSFVKVNDTVLTQSETVYDNLGNVLLSTQIERLSNAVGTGALTLSTGRYQSVASWYDGFGRSIATANYGTNGGVALVRPATVPARSDTVLVSEIRYDVATGRAYSTIDPAGKDHRTFVDALGRTVKTIANHLAGTPGINPDEDVTVEMTYHPSGQIAALVAKNATTGDQVTRYIYGSAKAFMTPLIYRNDLLAAEIYPDSDDFENSSKILENGLDGVADRVEFLYNRVGERMAKRDQNGTIHSYEYDNLGRLLHDHITTLAAGVDGAVRRISTAYDVVGNVKNITSYDASDNVVNEVMYEFGDNQKLAKLYQAQDGAVNTAVTPCVQYGYADVANSLRLETMTYPSGKTLTYDYDTFSRVSAIKDGVTPVVSYQHSGSGAVVKTTYNQPGLSLDYTNGLDRFGRITDHAWKKSATDVVRIQHAYDRVGNRTNRTDVVHTANSEVYTYDGVNQIKSLNRGASAFTETWNYDGTGNWLQYNRTGVATENRTHNKANEIATVCTHDRNGNMTLMPGLKGKYDAWNRLSQVKDASDSLLATYSYNGLNQRIKKTVGGVVTKSFLNERWQELEAQEPGAQASGLTTYIWGVRYIDDLVCRDKSTERLYSLADPNWNVVATCDSTGTVQERMCYDAFGKVSWFDAAFASKGVSTYDWNRTFTGQVLDETGLMLYRNRYYHVGLGRFVQRDPIGYRAGDVSLYRYVLNHTTFFADPSGLQSLPGTQNQQQQYGPSPQYLRPYTPTWPTTTSVGHGSCVVINGRLFCGVPDPTVQQQILNPLPYSNDLGGRPTPIVPPPRPPVFKPGDWNKPPIINSNNCYSYACDRPNGPIGKTPRPTNRMPQPGGGNYPRANISCPLILRQAKVDGLIDPEKNGTCRLGWHKVHFFVDPGQDYHVYREDDDGTWSHKLGSGPVVNVDASRKPILDPKYCNRRYPDGRNYTEDCGVLCALNRL